MGRDTIRHCQRALMAAALLDGAPGELPELEVLRAALVDPVPPPGPTGPLPLPRLVTTRRFP